MALLTNIDNKFSVSDAGAVRFNNAFTFPTADGDANYVLKTNGSGQLAWAPDLNSDAVTKIIGGTNITVSPATGLGDVTVNADLSGTVTGTGVDNRIAIWNGTTAIDSDSDFYVDGDTIFTTNLEASGNGSFSGTLTATNYFSSTTAANIFLGSVITKPGDNLGFVIRNSSNTIIGSFLRTSNTTSKLTTDNLALGGTTAQYVRGDGSFATFSPGTGTVTGTGAANRVTYWSSATNVTSDAGFTYNGLGRVNTDESFGVSKDGADTVANGPFFRLTNADQSRQYLWQLDASNNIDYWYYNGSAWVQTISLLNNGGATFAEDVLVGKTSNTIATAGAKIGATTGSNITRDSNEVLYLNRTTNFGKTLSIAKDGTTIGEIGTYGGVPYIGYSQGAGGGIMFNGLSIEPTGIGSSRSSNTNDVGSPNYKWRNAYFGNQVSAANYIAAAAEGLRINDSAAYISGYNTAGTQRTGYIQFLHASGTILIDSELGSRYTVMAPSSGAKVGIGTTGPNEKLHVVGNVFLNAGSAYIASYNNTYNYQASMRWAGLQLGNNGTNRIIAGRTAAGGGFQFWTNNTNDASDHTVTPDGIMTMVMTNTGNVGIGEPNPNYKLNVASGTNTDGIYLSGLGNSMSTGEYRQLQFGYSDTDTSYGSTIRFVVPDATTHGGQIEFYTDAGPGSSSGLGALALGMLIDDHQRVGIGNTNPTEKLDVTGNIICSAAFLRTSTSTDAWFGNGNSGTYTQTRLYVNQSNTSNNDANGYFFERGRLTDASTAEIRRWVIGARGGQKQMMLDGPGSLTVAGDVVAYGSPSDKRLKENIKPIESALDKVEKLQGVTFDWKESDSILDIKQDIGFIAQDVQKVIPELVRENEDGMLSMRHQGIAPILLEAIKELKAEIEELKLNNCNCK